MKKIVFGLIATLSISSLSFGQLETNKKLTDSTLVFGAIKEAGYVGESIGSYCSIGVDKYLENRTLVQIIGTTNCKIEYGNVEYGNPHDIYEIIYHNKPYFVEKSKLSTVDDSIYSKISNMNIELKEKFKKYATETAEILYNKQIKDAINFLDKCAPKGLAILDWEYYDESEYTDGTSAKISVYNPTKKKIKYLWFTFIGYNAVNDVVIDRLKGTSKITVKGVGPINPEDTGTYKYDYVWHTDLVDRAKISQIKIQYMDGTFKTILSPKEVTISNELYDVLKTE
jgi:hypothetical protein